MLSSSLRNRLVSTLRGTPVAGIVQRTRDLAEGAVSVVRAPRLRRTREGAGIVMYHGVTPEIVDPMVELAHIPAALFRKQIRHLRRHYRVVALGEVVECLDAGNPIPGDWAVLTFDDGYRNNLSCARQILREEGNLPMSVFVVTEYMGSESNITLVTTLALMAITRTRAPRIRVPRPGGEWAWRNLGSRRERMNCYWELLPVLKALPAPEQQAVTAEFFAQLADGELEEIRSRFPSYDWLDWDEVRELHADGVDVGGHTKTHTLLKAELSSERIRDEVIGCHQRLAKEIGAAPRHFAYPNGQPEDICDAAVDAIRQAGFHCALTTVRGTVRPGADRFHLPRITSCVQSMPRFRMANASGWR